MKLPFTRSSAPVVERPSYTVPELLEKFDIVGIEPTHIVATQLAESEDEKPDLRELGATGKTLYGWNNEDYNPALRGQLGLKTYDKMRRNDGQVKSTLRLVKTPVQSARWYMEPASERPKDQMISGYMENCLFKWMSTSWPQFLTESLLMLDFGFYAFEPVYGYNTEPEFKGKLIWKKLAPRHPLNITGWEWDENGGPLGFHFEHKGGSSQGPINDVTPTWRRNGGVDDRGNWWDHQASGSVFIPIEKLLVFTFDKEGGNMEGTSILRSAYKHWFYKENLYKIDAIQKERHGIGIPIIKLPPNFDDNDIKKANEIGRNLRTNERAHVVLPPMWEIEFADLKGNPVDSLASIEHHDLMIAKNVIGQFLDGKGTEDQQDLFIKSTRVIADVVRDVFNKYAIPKLVKYNWPNITEFPELRVRRIGETQDWRTLSFAMRNLIGAKAIVPDERLEDWLREEMDLPKADLATARDIDAPQGPEPEEEESEDEVEDDGSGGGDSSGSGVRGATGKNAPGNANGVNAAIGRKAPQPAKAGMPRQSKASGMKQQARGTGKRNTGTDNSGG